LLMTALVARPDGRQVVQVRGSGADPQQLAAELAAEARRQGAAEILAGLQSEEAGT
jgi:porphobilinogen deaminase